MDKFVTRKVRPPMPPQRQRSPIKRQQQAKLHQLKGVVVIYDVLAARDRLRDPKQSDDVLLQDLRALQQKQPGIEVMLQTKIGKTVNRLKTHRNPAVGKFASKIVAAWTKHVKKMQTRVMVDVRYDHSMDVWREKAREMIAKAVREGMEKEADEEEKENKEELGEKSYTIEVDHPRIEEIEQLLFAMCDKAVGRRYRHAVRQIVTRVKYSKDGRLARMLIGRENLKPLLEAFVLT